MQNILNQIDEYYQTNQYEKAYQYMIQELEKAMNQNQDDIVLSILSEMLGYYRVRGEFKRGNQMALKAKNIIDSLNIETSLMAATTYLNIATLYRVQGLYQDSYDDYQKALSIYQELLDETDERYIALYNNMSLLYQETNLHKKALEYELKALSLLERKENCEVERAITYTNLSQMYFQLQQSEKAEDCLMKAISLFETHAPSDPHYFATLASLAQSYYLKKDYTKALSLYEDVLSSIENTYGKNKDYETVYSNYQYIKKQMKTSGYGLLLTEGYFEDVGLPMLEEKFPDLLESMAMGLVGMGSECLGYDDEFSQDHDFGPGFCIWLPQDIYKEYGKHIQQAYDEMNPVYNGYQRHSSLRGRHRIGVFSNKDFYKMYLRKIPKTYKDWLYTDEQALLMMTAGKVFRDHFGEFTRIRETLHYFPEDIRIKKIAKSIAKMAQSGQYNYARCMRRYDEVAGNLALYEFINETFSCLYLLNRKYKPYYKWVYKGIDDLKIGKEIGYMLKDLILVESQIQHWNEESPMLNLTDKKVQFIEKICKRIVIELNEQGLSNKNDDFLESHVNTVINHIQDEDIRGMHIMEGS